MNDEILKEQEAVSDQTVRDQGDAVTERKLWEQPGYLMLLDAEKEVMRRTTIIDQGIDPYDKFEVTKLNQLYQQDHPNG